MLNQNKSLTHALNMGLGLVAGLLLMLGASMAFGQTTNRFGYTSLNLAVPDGDGAGISVSTNVSGASQYFRIHRP